MKQSEQQERLVAKAEKEFSQFREATLQLSKERIFDKAYEISTKEGILTLLANREQDLPQLEQLLSKESVLDSIYLTVLEEDCSPPTEIEGAISQQSGEKTSGEWGDFEHESLSVANEGCGDDEEECEI